eukprot:6201266-Pleurochrysis_carterae.AAC.2
MKDACVAGRGFKLLVSWEGYPNPDDDTWEPLSALHQQAPESVGMFVEEQKAAGLWPSTKQ